MTVSKGTVPAPPFVASPDPVVERISDLERKVEALTSQVAQLLWQAPTWSAALTQKAPAPDRYVELRRIIKVIGLTEILVASGRLHVSGSDDHWESVCAELYRRYGHLQFDGKPLWSKSPAPPSLQTKRLIAESLRRRQEA